MWVENNDLMRKKYNSDRAALSSIALSLILTLTLGLLALMHIFCTGMGFTIPGWFSQEIEPTVDQSQGLCKQHLTTEMTQSRDREP